MKALSAGVWTAMRKINKAGVRGLPQSEWSKINARTQRWLMGNEMVAGDSYGIHFTNRGKKLFDSAEFVDFWARSDG